jgi:hypothetical protein
MEQQSGHSDLGFNDLPMHHLQSLVLAMGGAGLGTCRAAAAINKDQQLILLWLSSRWQHPVFQQCIGTATISASTLGKMLQSFKILLILGQMGVADMLLTFLDAPAAHLEIPLSAQNWPGPSKRTWRRVLFGVMSRLAACCCVTSPL